MTDTNINWAALQRSAQENKRSKGREGDLSLRLLEVWNILHPENTINSLDSYQWQINREALIDELDALKPDWRGYLCSYQKSKS